MNLEPPLSMMKSGIVTKNITEQHKHFITDHSRDCSCSSVTILLRTVTNNIRSVTMALHHRSLHGTLSIQRVPVGPAVTHPWRLQFVIKVFAQSFLHATCTYGTLLHLTCGTRQLRCHVYLWGLSPSPSDLWDRWYLSLSPSNLWDLTAYVSCVL